MRSAVSIPVKGKQSCLTFYVVIYRKKVESFSDTNLFSISTKSVTGPLLPRVTLAIC